MLYTPTSISTTARTMRSMLQATACPDQAYQKGNKPSGASVNHRSTLESWNDELDSAYTTTAFDEVSSHLTKTSSDLNRLQQLYSEQYAPFSSCGLEQQTVARDGVQGCSVPRHSPHHFDNQQSGVFLRYLGEHRTHENPDCSLTIDPTSYRAFFGESESNTASR
jgi:hypothetical protein